MFELLKVTFTDHLPLLWVSLPFDPLDWGSYSKIATAPFKYSDTTPFGDWATFDHLKQTRPIFRSLLYSQKN